MTRTRTAVALVVASAPVLVLAACAGLGAGASSTEPADRAALAARAGPAGIAPELVRVTELDGFALATQSVGVSGGDGMAAVYTRADGDALDTVLLRADRYPDPTAVPCGELAGSPDGVLRCSVVDDEVHVVLEGEGVDPATLRAAAAAVRVPRADELDHLFGDVPVPGPPVERGDLPPHGDGAPVDPPALGG